jgi:hypothetical protein
MIDARSKDAISSKVQLTRGTKPGYRSEKIGKL